MTDSRCTEREHKDNDGEGTALQLRLKYQQRNLVLANANFSGHRMTQNARQDGSQSLYGEGKNQGVRNIDGGISLFRRPGMAR